MKIAMTDAASAPPLIRASALTFLLIALCAALAAATPPTTTLQIQQKEEIAFLTLPSLDEIKALSIGLGVAHPPPLLTAKGISEAVPFLSFKDIDASRSLSVTVFADDNPDVPWWHQVVCSIPVDAGAAPLKFLVENGGTPVPGRTDAMTLRGVTVQHLNQNASFAFSETAVTTASALKSPSAPTFTAWAHRDTERATAQIFLDLRALRKNAPNRFHALLEPFSEGLRAQAPNTRIIADIIADEFKALDYIRVSLDKEKGAFEIRALSSPVKLPQPGRLQPAGIPEDVQFRLHLACPLAELVPNTSQLVKRLMHDPVLYTAAQEAFLATFVSDAVDLACGGEALTIGIQADELGSTVYVAQMNRTRADAEARARRLVKSYNDFMSTLADAKDQEAATVQSYDDHGISVIRVRLPSSDESAYFIDIASHGSNCYLTLSQDESHRAASFSLLDAAKLASASTDVISGDVSFDLLAKILSFKPAVQQGMTPMQVTFSVRDAGNAASFNVVVPNGAAANILQQLGWSKD